MLFGSKLWRTRSLKRGKPACLRMEHVDIAPHLVGRPDQRGMAAGGIDALRAPAPHAHPRFGGSAAQISPPPQS